MDQVGFPTFKDWPSAHALTYEGTYWKWVERTVAVGPADGGHAAGGQRRALCDLQTNRVNSCDEMEGAKLQRKRLYELQDYIDAQYGGPGKGFLRVVTDPFQARRVVADGKLAVVMGMETSAMFGCRGNDQTAECDRAKIDRGLAEFRKLGIRSFFPVHKFDNPLGGTKMDGGTTGLVVNPGNKIAFGSYWDATHVHRPRDRQHADRATAARWRARVAGTPLQGVLGGQTPVYPPGPHCNARGLTSLGRYLIDKLMDSKSIVEIDHMGAADAQPDAGHPREAPLLRRDLRAHVGVAAELPAHLQAGRRGHPRGRLAGRVRASSSEWAAYRKLRDKRFYFGFGYGSDTNGLAVQGSPPQKPLAYPFTALDGKTKMDRQVTGQRTFDYNKEGVAHYGLYADWLADLRRTGGQQMAREMNRGAEAYLQMWERAEGVKQTTCRNATAEVTSRRLLGRVPAGRPRLRPAAPCRPADRAARCLLPLVRQAQQGRGHRGVQQPLPRGAGDLHRPPPPLGQGASRARARGRCADARRRCPAGVYVGRRLKGGARRVYLVRKKRVVAVGLAARSLVRNRKALAAALRGAVRGPVSTLDPPGAGAAAIRRARPAADRASPRRPRRRAVPAPQPRLRALHHQRRTLTDAGQVGRPDTAPGSPPARFGAIGSRRESYGGEST